MFVLGDAESSVNQFILFVHYAFMCIEWARYGRRLAARR